MTDCNHEWLTPEGNRTTCTRCGRDGFIMLDTEYSRNITKKKEYEAKLAKTSDLIEELYELLDDHSLTGDETCNKIRKALMEYEK